MAKIPICLSSDNNYAQHLCVTLVSILENKAPDDTISIFVLDGGISGENKNKILNLKHKYAFDIKFLPIDKNLHQRFPQGRKNHITPAAYYRLLLAEVCPDEDKLLYLDVDTIVKSSLKELFDTDITDKYFAGVTDCNVTINAKRLGLKQYCNSGVLLLNLKKWRRENITEKFFSFMAENEDKIIFHDQDVINCVLQESLLTLDKCWNAQISKYTCSKQYINDILSQAKIIHYIGSHKPWHPDLKQFAKSEYFKYLRLTEYKDYEKSYKIKLCPNILIYFIENLLQFIFSVKNRQDKKIMTILGLNFKIKQLN